MFALIHLCALHPTVTTHLIYVFLSLLDDMPIISLASDMVFIFSMFVARVFNINALSVANEVCSLVFTGVGLLYITSSWVFLLSTWVFLILGTLVGSRCRD